MKTLLSSFILMLFSNVVLSQSTDTIFFENFNNWEYKSIDSIFINYDEDYTADYNGMPGDWFVGNLGNNGADSLEVCALSSSWLVNFNPGNRNHLRLPGIYLNDTSAKLSWRSTPALGNLYMDGFTVLISNNPDFYYSVSSIACDTLMHFAQNINNDENQFSYGLMHNSFDSISPLNLTGVLQYPGKLTPHSVSLSAYAGQTVYISFLHNSDDDNYIAIDDILVNGNGSLNMLDVIEESAESFIVYPNPATDLVNLDLSSLDDVESIDLYNSIGMLLAKFNPSSNSKHLLSVNLTSFNSGIYFIKVNNKQGSIVKKLIKE